MSNQNNVGDNYPIISARKLAFGATVENIDKCVTGRFHLLFDDGVRILTNAKETIYSFYAWELHRKYPNTPLLHTHHFGSLIHGRDFKKGDLDELLGRIQWDVRQVYENDPGFDDRVLGKICYETVNLFYNEALVRTKKNIISLDALHIRDILFDDEIIKLKENTRPEREDIHKTNSKIKEILTKADRFKNNALGIMMRTSVAKNDQVAQIVGLRSEVTDIDSEPFPNPVMAGFGDGFFKFAYTFMESRSASKALMVTQDELQNTEYFSRRLQFQAQQVQRVHPGDCGSHDYMELEIGEKIFLEDGTEDYINNTKPFDGKYFLNPETQKLETYTQFHYKKYRGTTLKMRAVHHCHHPDVNGICATCFGELAKGIPIGNNIGQICTTYLTQKSSQAVLSTKHLDGNITIRQIQMDLLNNSFVIKGPGGSKLLFGNKLKNASAKLLIDKRFMRGAIGLDRNLDVKKINPSFFSRVPEITITFVEKVLGGTEEHMLSLSVIDGRNVGCLSYKMLEYIQKYGMEPTATGDMMIDLSNWNWADEFLSLPLKSFNASDHSKDIAEKLEARVADMEVRDKETNPDVFLLELLNTVNEKFHINVAILEIIMYGLMIRSADDHDYQLPKPWTKRGFGVKKNTMMYRSMGVYVVYQEHLKGFVNPGSFVYKNRPDHPVDGMICPREVFTHFNEQARYY